MSKQEKGMKRRETSVATQLCLLIQQLSGFPVSQVLLLQTISGMGKLRQVAHQMLRLLCVVEGMAIHNAYPNERDGKVFKKLLASRGCSSLRCWEASCSYKEPCKAPRRSTLCQGLPVWAVFKGVEAKPGSLAEGPGSDLLFLLPGRFATWSC